MQSFIISDYRLDHFYKGSGDAFCTLTDINGNKIHTHMAPITEENLDRKVIKLYPIMSLGHIKIFHPTDPVGVYSRKVIGKLIKHDKSVRLDIGGVQWKLIGTEKSHDFSIPISEASESLINELGFKVGDVIGLDNSVMSMTLIGGQLQPYFPIFAKEITKDESFVGKSQITWV